MKTWKQLRFSQLVILSVILLLGFGTGLFVYYGSERSIDRANARRYDSYVLAMELRQTSEDLTSMVRSYVATTDPRYRDWFRLILRIRDGQEPLPPGYQGIYWNFVVAGITPPGGPAAPPRSLLDRMKEAGFTGEEFELLRISKNRSDQLTEVEHRAMELASTGGPAQKDEALTLVYGPAYQKAKADIMEPIARFLTAVDQRTAGEVQEALTRTHILAIVLVLIGLALILSLVASYGVLHRILGDRLDRVHLRIEALGAGNFDPPPGPGPVNSASISGGLERTRLRLRDLYDQLTTARDQAQSANRAKGTFLNTMSHEIRTPLNGVIGINQLLAHTPLDSEQQSLLAHSQSSAAHLLQVLNDVLDLSKIEADRLNLEVQPFAPEKLFRDLGDLFSPQAREKGLTLGFRGVEGPFPRLVGDQVRIRQILVNLVSNALKFTDKGGADIIVSGRSRTAGDYTLEIAVEDSGIGITDEARARLFQPFQQADGTISRRFGGTGLGLNIAKNLVEKMGGTLTYEPRAGGGSRFLVVLSLSRAPADAEGPPAPQMVPTVSYPGRKILVIEDNPTNRMLLTALLQKRQISVTATNDVLEALDYAHRNQVELVIIDLHMPDIDGFEAARRFRERFGPGLPLVACSAAVTPQDKSMAREAGMDDFLEKPLAFREIDRVLATWLT